MHTQTYMQTHVPTLIHAHTQTKEKEGSKEERAGMVNGELLNAVTSQPTPCLRVFFLFEWFPHCCAAHSPGVPITHPGISFSNVSRPPSYPESQHPQWKSLDFHQEYVDSANQIVETTWALQLWALPSH